MNRLVMLENNLMDCSVLIVIFCITSSVAYDLNVSFGEMKLEGIVTQLVNVTPRAFHLFPSSCRTNRHKAASFPQIIQ